MGYRVERAPEFDQRFFEVLNHLVLVGRKAAASRLLDSLERAEGPLAATPFHGAPVRKHCGMPTSDALRWIPVDDYVAVYRAYEEDQCVVLEDLFFNGSDWKSFVEKR